MEISDNRYVLFDMKKEKGRESTLVLQCVAYKYVIILFDWKKKWTGTEYNVYYFMKNY